MFWGVTLESGNRYSQKVSNGYHLSMAALEPIRNGTVPANKEVSVMIEHDGSEYVLCTLEYGRVMQVSLDMIFDVGEVICYYLLSGEGVVHLSGYELNENDADEIGEKSIKEIDLDLVDEEEDEDWSPSKVKEVSDDNSDESEESESDEDDEASDHGSRKRKASPLKGDKTKKRNVVEEIPTLIPTFNGYSKTDKKMSQDSAEDSGEDIKDEDSESENSEEEDGEDNSSVEYSSEDESGTHNSSAGRTPMPKKNVQFGESVEGSPNLKQGSANSKKQKKKLSTSNTSLNQSNIPVTPKNLTKLAGNVKVEDLRIGSGPPAKKGRFVFLHYVGKLANGKVFETYEAPKKPFSFRLGKAEVIKGLEIGVEGMKVGGKRNITIPPNMGYGSQKMDVIPANSTLIFTVELKSVS